jgi:hypothetical protein
MGVEKFNFFLDEMIFRQNEDLWVKLGKEGRTHPTCSFNRVHIK